MSCSQPSTSKKSQRAGLKEEKERQAVSSQKPLPENNEAPMNYYSPRDNFVAPSNIERHSVSRGISHENSNSHRRQPTTWKIREHHSRSAYDHRSPRGNFTEDKRHSTSIYSQESSRGHRGFRPLISERSSSRTHSAPREENNRDHIKHSQFSERPNYQWREKLNSRTYPRPECSESSRTRRPPLERSLNPTEVTPPPPPPMPTTEEVMGELRDVTVQYISCSDPTESATRKRRVIQGEAKGLMAETASQMIEAAIISDNNYLASFATAQEDIVESQDLPRLPEACNANTSAPTKKRRGCPP
ncbi:unnamed protein product [Arabidopsis arenosa]|uniref:Uncharacterized protein n=1 Tax=Arabidopsis arenosa TaxID=38785 RepID=A0A8S2ANZ9_ARAAE|nr:unnamed protein product [Arabidopsis arenosa]